MSHFDAGKQQEPPDSPGERTYPLWFRPINFAVGTRKRFYLSIAYFAAFALLLVSILHHAISNRESTQALRNAYLQAEVSKLDMQIAEVEKLKAQTLALLDRAEVAKILLGYSQTETRILDLLGCRILSNEISLTGINKENNTYTLQGVADTAASLASLVKELKNGPGLYGGKVVQVNEVAQSGGKSSSSSVNFIIEASSVAPPQSKPGESTPPDAAFQVGAGSQKNAGNDAPAASKPVWFVAAGVAMAALFWGGSRIWRLKKYHPQTLRFGALASFLAILSCVGWIIVSSELNTLTELDEKENKLKDAYLYEKRMAVNLDLINKQLLDTQKDVAPFLKKLPTGRNSINDQIQDAIKLIKANGLRLMDSHPDDHEVAQGEHIPQMRWSVKVSGSFDRIGHFIADISRSNTSLRIQSYRLAPVTQDVSGDLVLDATLIVYRYFDDEELAAQGKANSMRQK